MNYASSLITLLLLCCLAISPGVANAQAASREQAIDMALERNGGNGKVLGVRKQTNDQGKEIYAVKVLTNGRVKIYRIEKI